MSETTEQQLLMKEKMLGTLKTIYTDSFKSFLRTALYDIPPERLVLVEAFGINRDELLIKCIKMVLDSREEHLKFNKDPDQLNLFNFN